MKQATVTVENIVHEAYRSLGDLEDIVTTSRRIGYGTTHEQASTLADLLRCLARIKAALGKMVTTATIEPSDQDAGVADVTDEQTEALANIGHNLSAVQVALRRIDGALRQAGNDHTLKMPRAPSQKLNHGSR